VNVCLLVEKESRFLQHLFLRSYECPREVSNVAMGG
jgi:hypothetical protein